MPLLSDVEEKDRQLATCGERLDVRGLVCLLPDNTGCHIKMLALSELALLQLSVTARRSTNLHHFLSLVSYVFKVILLHLPFSSLLISLHVPIPFSNHVLYR
jgi:hypothetical protein